MKSLPLVLNCAVARWLALVVLIDLSGSARAAQNAPSAPPGPDAQKCAVLTALNLEAAPGGPDEYGYLRTRPRRRLKQSAAVTASLIYQLAVRDERIPRKPLPPH